MAAAYEPPVSDDRGELLIRPSWRALGPWQVAIIAVVAMGLLAGCLELFGKSERLSWFAAFLGLCGLGLAGYVLSLTVSIIGSRITVTIDAILVRRWFWLTKRVDPKTIARVVRCSVRKGERGHPLVDPTLFALSETGRCVLSLYADRWSQADLDRIWRHVGVVPEGSWDDVIDDIDLHRRFPGAF